MPEKPEVITVAKTLSNKILGKKITNCNIYWDNIIAYPTTDLFKKKIIEQTIHNMVGFLVNRDWCEQFWRDDNYDQETG